jgi:hypothetical protein
MGRLSVSEAPAGPLVHAEGEPLPSAEEVLHRVPQSMQLLRAEATELYFSGRWRTRAPILLTPVLALLAALPWIAAAPIDPIRFAVSLVCLGCTTAAIVLSWPRRVDVRIRPRARELCIAGRMEALPNRARWVLGEEASSEAPEATYSAALVLPDGRGWPLLRGNDPAQVLRQLERALHHWHLPVESRWELPPGAAPWAFQPTRHLVEGSAEDFRLEIPGARVERSLRVIMSIMTSLVLLDLTFLLVSASEVLPYVHPLSVVLPTLTGAGLVLLTLGLLTARDRLLVGANLVQEACVLGWRSVRGEVPLQSVRGVHVLGPSERKHLLVDSSEGPLAIRVPTGRAAELCERLTTALGHPIARRPR